MEIFDLGKAKIIFTNRWGGLSKKPFNSLNLGFHVGDDFLTVEKNREILLKS